MQSVKFGKVWIQELVAYLLREELLNDKIYNYDIVNFNKGHFVIIKDNKKTLKKFEEFIGSLVIDSYSGTIIPKKHNNEIIAIEKELFEDIKNLVISYGYLFTYSKTTRIDNLVLVNSIKSINKIITKDILKSGDVKISTLLKNLDCFEDDAKLSPKEVGELSAKLRNIIDPKIEIRVTDDLKRIYNMQHVSKNSIGSSCMRRNGDYYEELKENMGDDLKIAYYAIDGLLHGRALLWHNMTDKEGKKYKIMDRIYSSNPTIEDAFKGWAKEHGYCYKKEQNYTIKKTFITPEGEKICKSMFHEFDMVNVSIMPYMDTFSWADDDYIQNYSDGAEYEFNETGGGFETIGGATCECCGNAVEEDDLIPVLNGQGEELRVCNGCWVADYAWSEYHDAYIERDASIYDTFLDDNFLSYDINNYIRVNYATLYDIILGYTYSGVIADYIIEHELFKYVKTREDDIKSYFHTYDIETVEEIKSTYNMLTGETAEEEDTWNDIFNKIVEHLDGINCVYDDDESFLYVYNI